MASNDIIIDNNDQDFSDRIDDLSGRKNLSNEKIEIHALDQFINTKMWYGFILYRFELLAR